MRRCDEFAESSRRRPAASLFMPARSQRALPENENSDLKVIKPLPARMTTAEKKDFVWIRRIRSSIKKLRLG
jgi:hypothetical protein